LLVRIPLTSGYSGRPAGKASMIKPNNGTVSTIRQAPDLAKRLEVELRDSNPWPLACHPWRIRLPESEMVRSVQVRISLQSDNDWSRPAQFGFVVT